jgi:hypothetical protein
VSANGSFDHDNVHDVIVSGLARKNADITSLPIREFLDLAKREQPSKIRLSTPSTPSFRNNRRRYGDNGFLGEEAGVQGPHSAIVPVCGDERAGVVGDTVHDARRRDELVRPRIARARASPSASSVAVSGPLSCSHSAMPRRPASIRSRCAAVSAIQALTVVPSAVAAASIASASSGGSEIDRFCRTAMTSMVVQTVGQVNLRILHMSKHQYTHLDSRSPAQEPAKYVYLFARHHATDRP